MRTALITGATSGIGKATAFLLANENFRLILCGRREVRLKEIATELSQKTEICTLKFDVSDRKQVKESLGQLPEEWRTIDILINNAGNAYGMVPIQEGNVDDWDAMIDINVKGLLYVSHAILPGMVERKRGHVINIGSIAGKETYPNANVYCASKHAVDAISQGMLLDLHEHNIKVSAINPGLVDTEFSTVRFKGDAVKAKNVYQSMQPLTAEDIADIILFTLTRPAHVNIVDLLVFPTAQASATKVFRKD